MTVRRTTAQQPQQTRMPRLGDRSIAAPLTMRTCCRIESRYLPMIGSLAPSLPHHTLSDPGELAEARNVSVADTPLSHAGSRVSHVSRVPCVH